MKIFISYSSATRNLVEILTQDLEDMGHVIWFDRELTGGHQWWAEILSQIRGCELFLFATTPQSAESVACKSEFNYARDLKKRILPVMLTDVTVATLPTALQELQIVDYRQRNKQQLISLTKALNNLPFAEPLPDPLPLEPETPLPPLARVHEKVMSTALTGDEQTLLLFEIKGFLEEENTIEEAKLILERFLQRQDLLVRVEKEIHSLLRDQQPGPAVKKYGAAQKSLPVFEHADAILSVTISPDGGYVATGSLDTSARIWDISTGQEVLRLLHKHTVHSVAFSPDGKRLLTGCEDNNVRLWDAVTGELIQTFKGHRGTDRSVVFSPDGKYALAGDIEFTARLWNISTGERLRSFVGHKDTVRAVAYSPSGRFVLTGSEDTTSRLWHTNSAEELRKFELQYEVNSVAFSPDERSILVARGNTAQTLDLLTGEIQREFTGHSSVVRSAAFSPDGHFILTGSRDSTVRLWDCTTGAELGKLDGHSGTVLTVAFSPDSKLMLAGSADRTARLWRLTDIIKGA